MHWQNLYKRHQGRVQRTTLRWHLVALCLWLKSYTVLINPNKDEQLSTVVPVTCIVVTRVKQVVRMRVGSGPTVQLSLGGLSLLRFYTYRQHMRGSGLVKAAKFNMVALSFSLALYRQISNFIKFSI